MNQDVHSLKEHPFFLSTAAPRFIIPPINFTSFDPVDQYCDASYYYANHNSPGDVIAEPRKHFVKTNRLFQMAHSSSAPPISYNTFDYTNFRPIDQRHLVLSIVTFTIQIFFFARDKCPQLVCQTEAKRC